MKKTAYLSLAITLSLLPLCAERVAVIGGGGAGITAAWLLEPEHEVTLYEKDGRLGGHADTVEVSIDGKTAPVEAGFEFFSKSLHPHFVRLLDHLNIRINSFTLVSTFYHTDGKDTIILPPFHNGMVEWESGSLTDIWRMLNTKKVIDEGESLIFNRQTGITLKAFTDTLDLSDEFRDTFLYPLLAGSWGVTPDEIKDFSAYVALKYLVMGQEAGTYIWYEAEGGLKRYVEAIVRTYANTKVKLNASIDRIFYDGAVYTIFNDDGTCEEYDHLVLATNPNQAGELIKSIPECQDLAALLGSIRYYESVLAIHGDLRFMPPDKNDWRIANIRYDGRNSAATMYKIREGVPPIFKSWLTFDVRAPEDDGSPMPSPLYALRTYLHPICDLDYFHVQRAVQLLQGRRNLWFAGLWTYDNDSHESAIISAINIAKKLAPDTDRLKVLVHEK